MCAKSAARVPTLARSGDRGSVRGIPNQNDFALVCRQGGGHGGWIAIINFLRESGANPILESLDLRSLLSSRPIMGTTGILCSHCQWCCFKYISSAPTIPQKECSHDGAAGLARITRRQILSRSH